MTDEKRPIERRLAAILAADIAGYSALMGDDEEGTVRDLKGHQAVVLPMVADFGGRVVDTAGDGILAEFPSVLNAVRCAIEIQQTMAERNVAVARERRMLFRIGLNLGDVVFDQNRIYGDGVNVAARLEALSAPGGICVSRSVREAIGNKLDVSFADLGERQVKNIAKPVHVYEVSLSDQRVQAQPAGAHRSVFRRLGSAPLPALALATAAVGAVCSTAVLAVVRFASSAPPPAASVSMVGETSVVPDRLAAAPVPTSPEINEAAAAARRTGASAPATIVGDPSAPGPDSAAPSAQAPPPPAPAAQMSTDAHPFDGTWVVTVTGGAACPLKTGSFPMTIERHMILGSTPEPGKVEPSGAYYHTRRGAADSSVVVEHRGVLAGDAGQGTYQVRGGSCVGVARVQRMKSGQAQATPASPAPLAATPPLPSAEPGKGQPSQPASSAGHRFEGKWLVELTGGPECPVKSNSWTLNVANGAILPSRPNPGRVEPDGTFTFSFPASVGPPVIVWFRGKFTGDRGKGTYVGGGGCVGKIELYRREG
jgi:class 3 adenylate cyclase